jgi:predicted aminopeptidase
VQTEPAVHQTEDNLALSGCEAVSYFRQSISACNFELDKSIVRTNTSFRTW